MLTREDLSDIAKVLRPIIQEELKPIRKDILFIKGELRRIEKKMDYMVNVLDREILKDRKRIDNLESEMKSKKSFI